MSAYEKRSDLKISGAGNGSGGVYDKVKIDGAGTVNGDVDCHDFVANGSAKVQGQLKAEAIRIHGSASVEGPVQSESMKIYGSGGFKQNVRSRSIYVAGHCAIKGQCQSQELELTGSLSVHGDVQSEVMQSKGSFHVDGRLHIGKADIQMVGPCKAMEIIGDDVAVTRKGKKFWDLLNFSCKMPGLEADLIEGDVLHLEFTEADIVRGNRVTLGQGCKVRLVEYRDELHQDPQAKVGEARRI
ncbi:MULTISPECIES: polymer-forming cytoskeletal protein [Paenibacillus]|uniref:Polymer-forming cytoskeletal protein n=1 Tax=Paenibacillus campinasensis TaxID=66347 RepID=A0ABW9T493_9BACL|nr:MULTISPECIES: polymer-forming cytoskeletal protein [Paenibacillus]MUG68109.1 polymer-forming cytoskeletal protein [Paenibacillus campinasensis]PAK51995.1 hypothetical protein CHH75_13250 [Paenibacillus sp. 7541]